MTTRPNSTASAASAPLPAPPTAPGPVPILDAQVGAVRRFNRFYTQRIGVLEERMLKSPFSLTEVRVLYELSHRQAPTAAELARDLNLDQGYLSRILARFEAQGFVSRQPSAADARQQLLSLTEAGRAAFEPLNRASQQEIAQLIAPLAPDDRAALVSAMQQIERLLGATPASTPSYILRAPRPGDLGWVVHRHGVLYAQEYGWDERFEALVAKVIADFVAHHDPAREACWIAERDGAIVGSVFLVQQSRRVGKLRLLYVEPSARGLGIGSRLVQECVQQARRVGYRELILWTDAQLVSARRIYEAAGFRLVKEEPHQSFGNNLVGQYWSLDLRPRPLRRAGRRSTS